MSEARIIDGKAMAAEVTEAVEKETRDLAERGLSPGLSVVIVGDDPASQVYVRKQAADRDAYGLRVAGTPFTCRRFANGAP